MTPEIYINAVIALHQSFNTYSCMLNKVVDDKLDKSIISTTLNPIDNFIYSHFIKVLDDALFQMTGVPELASYHLNVDKWGIKMIRTCDGEKYTWVDDNDFKMVIYNLIKSYRRNDIK